MPDEIEELPEGDTFDRAYVEKLRDENAKWRTKVRHYEGAFNGFNEGEQEYLLEVITTLSDDQEVGAMQLRNIAQNLLGDKFLEGIEGVGPVEAVEEEEEGKDGTVADKPKTGELTAEELQRILDERDATKEQTAAERQRAAEEEAMIEEVFSEIEAAGFERGTEAFQTALSLGASMAQSGKDVVFADIAPKIRAFHDIPEPAVEGDTPDAAVEKAVDADVDGSGKVFAKTATAGGAGNAGAAKGDWVAEAREAGKDVMEVARERMEARLDNA